MTARMIMEITGIPGTTFNFSPGDSATTILSHDTDMMLDSSGRLCIGLMLSCVTKDARYAWGTNPVQGASGTGHNLVTDAAPIIISNPAGIRDMRIIDADNGQAGVVSVTPLYSPVKV